MRINYCKYIISIAVFLLLVWTISCSGKSGGSDESKPAEVSPSPAPAADSAPLKLIKLVKPEENDEYKLNQSIDVEVVPEFKNRIPDSVAIYFDSNPVTTMKSEPWKCTIPGNRVSGTGRKAL